MVPDQARHFVGPDLGQNCLHLGFQQTTLLGKESKIGLSILLKLFIATVKTLYNVIRYNRIFNIRHKIAGKGSVSITIPSL